MIKVRFFSLVTSSLIVFLLLYQMQVTSETSFIETRIPCDCAELLPPRLPPTPFDPRCNSGKFQSLVGLENQVFRQKFYPANTNIYTIGEADSSSLIKNRLNIELNQHHRVQRVFCS